MPCVDCYIPPASPLEILSRLFLARARDLAKEKGVKEDFEFSHEYDFDTSRTRLRITSKEKDEVVEIDESEIINNEWDNINKKIDNAITSLI